MSSDPGRSIDPSVSHLGPALISVVLAAVCLVSATGLAKHWSRAHLDALGPADLPQKNFGVFLQRELALARDIIPLYGSSELVRRSEFRASEFFARRPRGFSVSPVGARGTPLLVTLQQIGATGQALAGRKVVVLLSPPEFLSPETSQKVYAGNYSRLQSATVIFGSHFDLAFKRRVATRLLRFPEVLEDDPVLRFALNRLVNPGFLQRVGYDVALPFGRLNMQVGRWADAVSVLELLARQPLLRQTIPAVAQPVDWDRLTDSAIRIYRPRTGHNPAGFEDSYWKEFGRYYIADRPRTTDSTVQAHLEDSPCWTDLELIVEALRNVGAKPLVISIPIPGQYYYSYVGLSPSVWQPYYRRLRAVVSAAGGSVLTFEGAELHPFLLRDGVHPTPEGWLLLDRAIDGFYHDPLQ